MIGILNTNPLGNLGILSEGNIELNSNKSITIFQNSDEIVDESIMPKLYIDDQDDAVKNWVEEQGYITSAPVTSVNEKTGDVILTAEDVGALPDDTPIPSLEGYATEAFVNSSINNIAAFFITKNANGDPFSTKAEFDTLSAAVEEGTASFYSGGEERTPTKNDYVVILNDETNGILASYEEWESTDEYIGSYVTNQSQKVLVTDTNKDALGIVPGETKAFVTGENPTVRYIYMPPDSATGYSGDYWNFQYIVNNSGLTAAQWAAVNSGITAEKVEEIDTLASKQWVENKGYLIANADAAPQNIATQDVYKSGNKLVTNDKVFQVKYGETEYQDIIDAYNADKSIICNYNNNQYRLLGINNDTNTVSFIRMETMTTYVFYVTASNQYTDPAAGRTNLQGLYYKNREPIATASNDNSYPSSKAVREYVEGMIGDISNTYISSANGEEPDIGMIPISTGSTREVEWKQFVDYSDDIKYQFHLANKLLGWKSGNYVYLYDDTELSENAKLDIVYENERWYLKSLADTSRQLQVNAQYNYAAFYASSSQVNGWLLLDDSGNELSTLPVEEPFYLITTNNSKWFALTNTITSGDRYRVTCYMENSKDDLLEQITGNTEYQFTVSEVVIGSHSDEIYAKKIEIAGKPGEGKNSAVFGTGSATGDNSVAIGTGTVAEAEGSLALGRFNVADDSKAIIVGGGGAGSPRNVFTVGTGGDVYTESSITAVGDITADDVSLKGLKDTVDEIWYGDSYDKIYEQTKVQFIDDYAALNNFPFTEPGNYRFRIGDSFYEDAVTQEQISNEEVYFSGILDIQGTQLVDDNGREDGEYYVSAELITITKIPGKYLDINVPISYGDLVDLRDAGKLIPGMQYRITDYECTVANNTEARVVEWEDEDEAIHTGHQFDIIVVADDEYTLNENARACLHYGDIYYSNANLPAWELKYSLDNDTNRFAWADIENGKGIIYWLKDNRGNECPYDFKQIQFERNNKWLYTFGGETDASVVSASTCYSNVIPPYFSSNKLCLNNIVFNGHSCYSNIFSTNCYRNTFDDNCYSNTFGDNCYSNIFGSDCYSNIFGDNYWSNTFGDNCHSNTFGSNNCYSNTFGDNCYHNTFGNYCCLNTFSSDCRHNTFGNYCSSNTFSNNCYYNTFGDNCHRNTFSFSCYSNTFCNYCSDDTFGRECSSNTFGNGCSYNTFGNGCQYNTFGSGCSNNTFGIKTDSFPKSPKNYYRYNIFDNGVSYTALDTPTNPTNFPSYCQNYHVLSGFNNTTSYKTVSGLTRGNAYCTYIGRRTDDSSTIVMFNPMDLGGVAIDLDSINDSFDQL